MYALMCYKTALSTECLITNITSIRALATMYAIMLNQTTRHCMPYYTHHKHKGARQHVCNYA
jgi:hypothetical protein